MVMVTAASGSSDGGDYAATSLSSSATWSGGGSAGDFSWSYPLRTPPGLGANVVPFWGFTRLDLR